MRIQGFERVALAACLAFALLAPETSWALSLEETDASKSYGQVLVDPLIVGYTRRFLSVDELSKHRVQGEDVSRMQRHYQEVVVGKIGDAYPITSKSGPGVVRLEAFLIDHVLDKREWLRPTSIMFRGAPQVRLLALLRDSLTGEVVDSVGLLLEPRTNRLMKESPGFYWHFMRKVFDRVATRVRWSLKDGVPTP